jgi:PAS domain S-box-containing protein
MPHPRQRSATRRRPDVTASRIRTLERALARLTTKHAPEDVMRQRAEIVLAQVPGISVAVLIASDRARYVDANAAATLLTGYSRSELLQMTVWDLTPTPRRNLGLRLWRDFLRRGRMRGHYQVRRKDGTLVRARYVAVANVLPGIHVSALTTPALIAQLASGALSGPKAT